MTHDRWLGGEPWWTWAVAAALVLGAPGVADAQDGDGSSQMIALEDETGDPDDAQARALFEAGSALYAAGEFGAAARRFQEAYELSGRSALLYNMYVAYRDAGDAAMAADALGRYLDEVPDARDRVTLEARLRSLRAQAAAGAGTETETGDRAGIVDMDDDTAADPGDTGGGSGALEALPFIVGGLGVAALVAGAGTGIAALGRESDLEDACPNDRCRFDFVDQLEEDRDQLRRLSVATDVLLVSGAVLLVTGVVLWAVGLGEDDEEADDTARVEPLVGCGTTGCVAGLRGAWQ